MTTTAMSIISTLRNAAGTTSTRTYMALYIVSPPPTLSRIIAAPLAAKCVTQVMSAVASTTATTVQKLCKRLTRN